jgi:uncharacterized membrane protein YccC
MFVFVTLSAFAGVYGDAAARLGTSIAVAFAIALASPAAGPMAAAERGVWVIGGGAWAMLLGLALWPVRVYLPARRAVGAAYRALAAHVDHLGRLTAAALPGGPETAIGGHALLRQTIETARETLAATRRGRQGESGRGARLLVLIEIADECLGHVSALTEVLAGAGPELRADAAAALADLSGRLVALATQAETEERVAPPPPRPSGARAGDDADHAGALLERLFTAVDAAARIGGTLADDAPAPEGSLPIGLTETQRRALDPIRQNLDLGSTALRHALRVGLAATAATALTRALGLERGYWVTLTVILLLQPHVPATLTRTIQRVAGTTAGGLITALLASLLHTPAALLPVVFVMAAVSVAVLQLNYALFATFLTPTFVLLAEINGGDWRLAEVRVVNTLLGAAIALAGAWLLWPSWERARFPALVADALAAVRAYARAVAAAAPAAELRRARRQVGLAINNAEASLARLLAEPRARGVEPPLTLLFYARRLTAALTALASLPDVAAAAPAWPVLERTLGELEAAARDRRPPPPHRAEDVVPVGPAAPALRVRVARLLEQVEVLHRAVDRWLEQTTAAAM